MEKQRGCGWEAGDPLMVEYHDTEWGVPKHGDRRLFEDLVLDGAQAGLSWRTILRKRENYRRAFDNFEPALIAAYDGKKLQSLLLDAGIIRNRLKIQSAISNAAAFLKVQEQFGSFDAYVWAFVDGRQVAGHWDDISQIPASTPLSDRLSLDLKKRGFKFVGTTICYAFMQAVGMVNDHVLGCFRREACMQGGQKP